MVIAAKRTVSLRAARRLLGPGAQLQGESARLRRGRGEVPDDGRGLPRGVGHLAVQHAGPHDPVGPLLPAVAVHVEVVGAAVQHVDPLRRRGGGADLVDDVAPDVGLPVALEPLAGVLPLGGGLAVMDPLAGQADDPLVLGPDDQGGMEVEAIAAAVARGGQVGDPAADAEVQLGRVAQDQEAAGAAGPRPLPVRGGDRLEGDAVGVQEAIGGLGLGPALHLPGDAGGGVGGHPGGDEGQPLGAPPIAQVGGPNCSRAQARVSTWNASMGSSSRRSGGERGRLVLAEGLRACEPIE